jgi:hypothetical protein
VAIANGSVALELALHAIGSAGRRRRRAVALVHGDRELRRDARRAPAVRRRRWPFPATLRAERCVPR